MNYADAQQALNEVKRERDNYRAVLEGAQYEDIDTIGTQARDLCLVVGKEAAKWSWKILAERNIAQATVAALQAQHKDLVLRNKILRDRLDLPAERCAFHEQVEALQRERDGLEAKCLEEHVTTEQAQAALDAEREKVKGLERELASYKAGIDGEYGDRIRAALGATTPARKGGDGE
ncbi:MAG: hypothetical protein HQL97_00320 [Magnetococcales bacterium]|nr:hypothetical protein [Magnetococcales bacterium]